MISEYTTKARLAPTALAAPPILLLFNTLVDAKVSQWLDTSMMAMLFGKGTAVMALAYLMMQVNRLIGLEIFQRWVSKDELDFPTSRWLVATNTEMSPHLKQLIDQKLRHDFRLGILPASMGDTPEVRRHNADLVGLIRQFVGSPAKLLRYNIEYGFFRNLIGASVPVLLAGFGNAYLHSEMLLPDWAYHLTLIYVVFAVLLILLSKPIIVRLGNQYARVLFQVYLDKRQSDSAEHAPVKGKSVTV